MFIYGGKTWKYCTIFLYITVFIELVRGVLYGVFNICIIQRCKPIYTGDVVCPRPACDIVCD